MSGFSFGSGGGDKAQAPASASSGSFGNTAAPAAASTSAFQFGVNTNTSAAAAPPAGDGFFGNATAPASGGGNGAPPPFVGVASAAPPPSTSGGKAAAPNFGVQQPTDNAKKDGTPAPANFTGFSAASASTDSSKMPAASAGGFKFDAGASNPAQDNKTDSKPAASFTATTGGSTAFSFAGANKPAEESKTDSKPAPSFPAPSGAAPAFPVPGGTAPKPAEESKTDSKPAASFTAPAGTNAPFGSSGANEPAEESKTDSTAPGTPAPPTPGPPPPVNTPGQTPAGGSAAAPTTPATTASEPTKLQYEHLSVEQILNKFQQELEKDTLMYLEEARRVAEYDSMLRDSGTDIAKLTELLQRGMVQQKEIEQTLTGIGNFQQELDNNLDTVEQNVDALFAAQSHLLPVDADVERETAYNIAANIDRRLQALQESLNDTVTQMDNAGNGLTGDVAKIVEILNQHQNSLAALEDASRRMEHDLAQVNRVLGQH